AEVTSGDPLQCMDIAQAAGAAFNIRLQIIAGTVIALVALVLLCGCRLYCLSDYAPAGGDGG
ncbi:hypothetical protein MJL33_34435, partial [Salmonella enterica subsp. enterica serovar Kentucky]|nr:hypothetical protein [Salmonella enterica subsp. enterica serovar Kentucky]